MEPVTAPDIDPDDGEQVTITVGKAWLYFVVGAATQLMLPTTWDTTDPDELRLILDRANFLINMLAEPLWSV